MLTGHLGNCFNVDLTSLAVQNINTFQTNEYKSELLNFKLT
jgi:hypothetical protein